MKIDGRLFVVVIMALVLIPGAWAISTGGGTSISGSGSSQGNFATNGVQTTGYAVASGVLSDTENHWVEDTTGKHAEVGISVDRATKLSFSYSLSPNKDKTKVSPQSSLTAQEWLDVTNAKQIRANANARNGEGDQANVNLNILIGSITGYKNSATATMTQATASQSATSASGNQIIFNSWANNKELDNACPSLQVTGGSVTGYATSETATAAQATASQSAKSISGQAISFWEQANNKEGDTVGEQAGGGSIYPNVGASAIINNGLLTTYSGSSTATRNSVTKDSTIASLSGSISLGPYTWNKEGDSAGVYDTITGSVSGYTDHASATSSSVNAKQTASSITNGPIEISGYSYNAARDYSGNVIYIPSGTISNLETTTSATSSSENLYQTASSITSTGTGITTIEGYSDHYANGGGAGTGTQIINGKLSGYSDTESATSTLVTASQQLRSASGSWINLIPSALNSEGDQSSAFTQINTFPVTSTTQITNGQLSGYSDTASSTPIRVIASQNLQSASGSLISSTIDAENSEGDLSTKTTQITNGKLSGYSDGATATPGKVNNQVDLSATGKLVDFSSHVENKNPAEEGYDENANGKIDPEESDIKHMGTGDFDIHAQNGLKMSIESQATNNNLIISPTLPKDIHKAIILEPYHQTTVGSLKDYDQVVIPTLLDKDYAVLRYTDSGASEDKFKDLYKYNVVLINSHMNPKSIGLSTTLNPKTGELSAVHSSLSGNTLGKWYNSGNPPYKSMVFLNGCQSTNSPPVSYFTDDGSLVQAFKKATLLFGFKEDVDPYWAADSISEFFGQMRSGSTTKQSLEYVNCIYSIDWALQNPSSDNPALLDWKGSKFAFDTVTL